MTVETGKAKRLKESKRGAAPKATPRTTGKAKTKTTRPAARRSNTS